MTAIKSETLSTHETPQTGELMIKHFYVHYLPDDAQWNLNRTSLCAYERVDKENWYSLQFADTFDTQGLSDIAFINSEYDWIDENPRDTLNSEDNNYKIELRPVTDEELQLFVSGVADSITYYYGQEAGDHDLLEKFMDWVTDTSSCLSPAEAARFREACQKVIASGRLVK